MFSSPDPRAGNLTSGSEHPAWIIAEGEWHINRHSGPDKPDDRVGTDRDCTEKRLKIVLACLNENVSLSMNDGGQGFRKQDALDCYNPGEFYLSAPDHSLHHVQQWIVLQDVKS